jgi:tetratricopeptide (TPR) repeat protein
MIPPIGKIEQVARHLERLVKRHPKRAKAYLLLGAIYRELPGWPISIGDEKRSLKLLERGLPYAKKNAEYLLEVAATYAALDREDEARATYQKAARGSAPPHLIWERDDARAWARKMIAELDD